MSGLLAAIAPAVVSGLFGMKGAKESAKAQLEASQPYSVHAPLTNIDYNKGSRTFDMQLDPALQGIMEEQLRFGQTEPFFRNQYMNFVNDRYGLGMFDSLPGGRLPLMDEGLQNYANGVPLRDPSPAPKITGGTLNNAQINWLGDYFRNQNLGIDEQSGLFGSYFMPMAQGFTPNQFNPSGALNYLGRSG